mgnify:CR=1 FL=1
MFCVKVLTAFYMHTAFVVVALRSVTFTLRMHRALSIASVRTRRATEKKVAAMVLPVKNHCERTEHAVVSDPWRTVYISTTKLQTW